MGSTRWITVAHYHASPPQLWAIVDGDLARKSGADTRAPDINVTMRGRCLWVGSDPARATTHNQNRATTGKPV